LLFSEVNRIFFGTEGYSGALHVIGSRNGKLIDFNIQKRPTS
jgi:hypothetical protein